VAGDPLREHYSDVRYLSQALTSGESGLIHVPVFLLRLLREGGWKEFVTPLDDHVQYTRFEDFVTTKPVRGLGATMALLRNLCRDHQDVQRELDKVAGPAAKHGGSREEQGSVSTLVGKRDSAYLSRRLLRDAPEIFAALERGEFKSVRAAAKSAGLIHEPTTLEQFQRLWLKLTPDERLSCLRWMKTQ
jgi:hypothetical protein